MDYGCLSIIALFDCILVVGCLCCGCALTLTVLDLVVLLIKRCVLIWGDFLCFVGVLMLEHSGYWCVCLRLVFLIVALHFDGFVSCWAFCFLVGLVIATSVVLIYFVYVCCDICS